MTTREILLPILRDTYGNGSMVEAAAKHLAHRIDGEDWDSRGRAHMVMVTCWDWFSGGDTAASVASKIEAALS